MTGLLGLALAIGFVRETSTPSLTDDQRVLVAKGELTTVDEEDGAIRVRFAGKSSFMIANQGAELLAALEKAVKRRQEVEVKFHLLGAHFHRQSGFPVYWVQSLRLGAEQFGPFEAISPWSWRVLVDEQVALLLGIALHAESRHRDAREELDRALATQVLAPHQRGLALGARGDLFSFMAYEESGPGRDHYFVKALEDFVRAQALLPDADNIALAHADMLEALGAHDEALVVLEDAARRFIQADFLPRIRKVGLLRALGRYEESLAEFDAMKSHEGKRMGMMYHCHHGWTLQLLKRHQLAIDAFTAGMEMQTDYVWAYVGRGCAHAALNSWQDAVGDFNVGLNVYLRRAAKPYDASDRERISDLESAIHELGAARESRSVPLAICKTYTSGPEKPRERSSLLDRYREN